MRSLTPKLASELSEFAYESRLQTSYILHGIEVTSKDYTGEHFSFDTQKNMVKGVSGGVICRALNLESGFVYIGVGRGSYI